MTPALEVAHLSFRYPDGRQALHDVSLSVGAGERVALLGPNGSGKTTLLRCVAGLHRGAGRVEVSGVPVVPDRLKEARSRMGFLFQDPASQLVLPQVADDVAFGLAPRRLTPVETAAQVSAALNAVGLRGFEDRWVHRLSLGEQKRVALAGLLVMEPALLLLDEPTAGLDSAAREMVLGFLARLPAAMLLTTHDLDATERLRARRLYLDGGRLGQPRSQGGAAGHPRLGANR